MADDGSNYYVFRARFSLDPIQTSSHLIFPVKYRIAFTYCRWKKNGFRDAKWLPQFYPDREGRAPPQISNLIPEA